MDSKIESFLTNAALKLGEVFESTTAAAPAAAKPTPGAPAPVADSVDHAGADGAESTGVVSDDYQRFDTSGDHRLDDQLLRARTGGPAAATNASKPSGPPQMTATGQYNAGDQNRYELRFDRPVSRAEAEKVLFKGDRTPAPRERQVSTRPHDQNVRLVPTHPDAQGRSSEWTLGLPSSPKTVYDDLKPGAYDVLLDARPSLPAWIPAGTRQVLESGEIPRPGDPRFSTVRTSFQTLDGRAAPQPGVTCWRDGNVTVRYDARSGAVEMFRDQPGAEMGGYNRSMTLKMLEEGKSLEQAATETYADFNHYLSDGLVTLAIGSPRV